MDNLLDKLVEKVQGWGESIVKMLPNLGVAVLVVIGFGLLAKYASRLARRGLNRISNNREINALLSGVLRVAVLVAGVFVALGILDLDKTVTSLLAGVGIVGLALGFAFQDIASNFMAGVILALRRPYRTGDLVQTGDTKGTVLNMDLRTTRVRTLTGQYVIVPNKDIIGSAVTNYTRPGERRVDLAVGVSYGDDLAKVKQVATEAVRGVPGRDESRDVELFYSGFGDSSIDFDVRFWLKETAEPAWLAARSEAVMRIKRAFDESGITIPFPIRTLDFAEVGGTRLDQVLRPFEPRSRESNPGRGDGEADGSAAEAAESGGGRRAG